MIEKIAETIAKKLIKTDNGFYDSDELDIIKYGMECILNISIPFIFYVFFSIMTNVFFQMLVWFCCFLFFRNIIGGYHANSHIKCIIYSTIYGIFAISLISVFNEFNILVMTAIMIVMFIIHIIINPVISSPDKDLKHYKRKALLFLMIFTFIILILRPISVSFSISVFLGILSAELLFIISILKS